MVSRWVARTAVVCLGLGVAGFVACSPSSGAGDNQGSAANLGNGGAAPAANGNGGKGAGATGATGASASASGGDTPILGPGMMRTDPNSGPDASCAATSAKAEQQVITKEIVTQDPVALFLVQDRSGSMRDTPNGAPASKWQQTVDGVNAFVADPKSANLDVALGFFPVNGGQCDGTNYSTPVVAMARLPSATQVQAVGSALTNNAPGGGGGGLGGGASGTPIEGALRGGENFCMIYQSQNPLEKCVVVLLTDGAPNGCDGNFMNLAAIAADAKTRANVMTFTVGMDGADFNLLDMIANAGGSNCGATPSCNVNGTGSSLVDALNKIRTTVTKTMTVVQSTKLACEYAIPDPMNGEKLDRNKVNVQITHDGTVEKIGQVPDMASCAQFGGKGWYYDNPADPKSVKFCSATCTSLGSPDAGLAPGATPPKVDVLFGCKTVTAIPA